ncbi:MAG: aminodeoxychorismate lyase, partial [Alphaproteobacteria bacterium]|nr:aminodeoxychorismate lyase [Alphaproteobacteria bacterium]
MTPGAGGSRAEGSSDRCLVDGQPGRVIEVHDRGLAYGDGLFETLAVRAGAPCRWAAHLERLAAGAVRLGIALPPPGRLRAECARISAGIDAGGVKLILTRGCGPRGYLPP